MNRITYFCILNLVSIGFLMLSAQTVGAEENGYGNSVSENVLLESEMETESLETENSNDVIVSGQDGGLHWTLNAGGELFIWGTGNGQSLISDQLDSYRDQVTVLKVNVTGNISVNCDNMSNLYRADFSGSTCRVSYISFQTCSSLNSLDLSTISTENVTNMSFMFWNCNALESLDLSSFNTRNVTHMSCMFYDCSALESLDLSSFNTGNVTDMQAMFLNCSALESLDLSSFNTGNVTDMSDMFRNCNALKSLDLSSFNTGNVTTMYHMFGCQALENIDLSSFNTRNVTDMSGMFRDCVALKSLDLFSFDTGNVTDMSQMFYCCSALESLDLSSFNTGNVTDMSDMFRNCSALKSLDLSSFNTGNVTNMSDMFNLCQALKNIDLSSFNTGKVTDMSRMFYCCTVLKNLDLSSMNTGKVVSMEYMFDSCRALENVDLSSLNTENVSTMKYMFNNCSQLKYVDLNGINAKNVTDMSGMFYQCSELQSVDFTGAYIPNLIDMRYMFYWCDNLQHLDLSGFDLSKLTYDNGEGMKIFSTMDCIETLRMPANIAYSIDLPCIHGENGDIIRATWLDDQGQPCVSAHTNQNRSILYHRNDVVSSQITDFVKRMYQLVLGRPADTGGLRYWSTSLKNGVMDGASIAGGFILSEEFNNWNHADATYVDILYQTFFNRTADDAGRAYWITLLNQGNSREYVLSQFVNSKEFSQICDSYGIARGTMEPDGSNIYNEGVRNFVLRNYTKALGRKGETEGVEYWSHLINKREMAPLDCAMSFFHSQEFLNRNLSNEDYVETLYATYFDRASDAEGKNYWLFQMQMYGMSRDDVLANFAHSQEFRQIMSGYGL